MNTASQKPSEHPISDENGNELKALAQKSGKQVNKNELHAKIGKKSGPTAKRKIRDDY